MTPTTILAAIRRALPALALALILAVATLPGPAGAQSLDDIISKKKLQVGVLVDFPPFGLTNAENKPDGYDIDVAKLMGKYLGVEVEIVPVTGPNRIPFLLTNKVDVLVASFGITPERARQVQFSIPYASFDIMLLAPKATKIVTAEDIKSFRVGVARASTQDTALTAIAPKGAQIMRFDDDATTVQALLSGQIEAIGVATVVAKQIQEMKPDAQFEPKIILRRQPNGIALRRNQGDLLQWVNTFVYFIKNNGELDAIHQKWLGQPLPQLPVF